MPVQPKMQNKCSDIAPEVSTYLTGLDRSGITTLALCSVLTLMMYLIYLEEFWYLQKDRLLLPEIKIKRRILLAIYPITSCLCLVSLFVPGAAIFVDLFIQLYLSVCIFIFLQMMISHLGGVPHMTRTMSEHKIQYRAPPCCCCCCCLPSKHVSRNQLRGLQAIVLQMVIFKPLVVLFTTIIFTDVGLSTDEKMKSPVTYIKLLGSVTTLLAMYGLIVTFRLAKGHLHGTHIILKFLCLKLSILVIDLQGALIQMLAGFKVIPCTPPLGSVLAGYTIQHSLLVLEMFLLAVLAAYSYRRPVKQHPTASSSSQEQQQQQQQPTEDSQDDTKPLLQQKDSYGSIEEDI